MSARLRNADFIDRFIDLERKVRAYGLASPWVDLEPYLVTGWLGTGTDPFHQVSARRVGDMVYLRGLLTWTGPGAFGQVLINFESDLVDFAPQALVNTWVGVDPDNHSDDGLDVFQGWNLEVSGTTSLYMEFDQNHGTEGAPVFGYVPIGGYLSLDGVSYSVLV